MSERHTQLLQEEKLLRKQNRLNNEFVSACRLGNLDLIKKHVDMGHDVNNKNEDGKTGLMTATLHEQLHVVSYLIQFSAIMLFIFIVSWGPPTSDNPARDAYLISSPEKP